MRKKWFPVDTEDKIRKHAKWDKVFLKTATFISKIKESYAEC